MRIIPLNNQQRLQGYTHRVRITHADLTEATADTAQELTLYTARKGTTVQRAATYLRTGFRVAATAAHNNTGLAVGDGDLEDRFVAVHQVNDRTTGAAVLAKGGTDGSYSYVAAGTIKARFHAMASHALSALDTGEVDILLGIVDTQDLSNDTG